MSEETKYDSALLAILQNEGKIAPFLDVVLGFLYRRTDFFRVMKTGTESLGFPPGVASKLLMNIFKRYETLSARDSEKATELKKARKEEPSADLTAKEDTKNDLLSEVGATPEATASQNVNEDKEVAVPSTHDTGDVRMETEASQSENTPAREDSTSKDAEEEESPELVRKRQVLQANPLTYNGAETETYFWSQNITDADVRIKVSKSVVKGKQVKVDIQPKHIRVSVQEPGSVFSNIIDQDLEWEVKMEESVWTLNPGEFVHLNLEKRQERWWENVFVDEPKINTRKIDCSRPMTDLDDEAQAKIEEMMFNQRQKQLGLPQSHEVKTHDMLRKAWDAEGSPFKGQPFDPSQFSVDPSGVVNIKE